MERRVMDIEDRQISLERGRIARQADGAVIVRQNDTLVLVTAVAAPKARDDIGFFPLTVEYQEKAAAGGRIPGGFLKREGRASEHEILSCRLIDRSVRPLFPPTFRSETQIIATVLSADDTAEPEVLAMIGASAALQISDIPWGGPTAGVRIASRGGRLIPFPTREERLDAELDLVVSVGREGLVMVEGQAREIPEEHLVEALLFAQQCAEPILAAQEAWGGRSKRELPPSGSDPELAARVDRLARESLETALTLPEKQARRRETDAVCERVRETLLEGGEDSTLASAIDGILDDLKHQILHRLIASGKRIDGRRFDEIRPIEAETGWIPRTHGSALFTRGETQAVVTCTLGTSRDEQIIDSLFGESRSRFLLHYNFPPFSVGEVRPMRGPGRREIGHGNLARRAIEPLLPPPETFPYTIRIVSDITESNGSSSMATVCGASLALMDAGVPIVRPVAGIAMGLVKTAEQVTVLSDILGDEDHLGDMDFKVAGTEVGITAVQMDNKLGSLSREILARALEQARLGRLHILGEMAKARATVRETLAPTAPRIVGLKIRPSRIRDLIGPGGSNIQSIQERFGVRIEVDPDGAVRIYADNLAAASQASRRIRELTAELEVGKFYRGRVVATKPFGAFVKIFESVEALVPISELDEKRVERTEDVVKNGEEIVVRVEGVDRQGRIVLSRRAALHAGELDIENP